MWISFLLAEIKITSFVYILFLDLWTEDFWGWCLIQILCCWVKGWSIYDVICYWVWGQKIQTLNLLHLFCRKWCDAMLLCFSSRSGVSNQYIFSKPFHSSLTVSCSICRDKSCMYWRESKRDLYHLSQTWTWCISSIFIYFLLLKLYVYYY